MGILDETLNNSINNYDKRRDLSAGKYLSTAIKYLTSAINIMAEAKIFTPGKEGDILARQKEIVAIVKQIQKEHSICISAYEKAPNSTRDMLVTPADTESDIND